MALAGAGAEIRAVARASTPSHAHLRQRLAAVTLATLVVDAVGSVLVLLSERRESGTEITNLGDAVFWTTAQLLTVSSQMVNPISTQGRVVDLVLELYAITVVAALAGSFAAFFHRRGLERDPLSTTGDG